jgi:hypothetical protein
MDDPSAHSASKDSINSKTDKLTIPLGDACHHILALAANC